jgi:hypothetical protein
VIEPLEPLPRRTRIELADEGARLLAFVAGDAVAHDVRIATT